LDGFRPISNLALSGIFESMRRPPDPTLPRAKRGHATAALLKWLTHRRRTCHAERSLAERSISFWANELQRRFIANAQDDNRRAVCPLLRNATLAPEVSAEEVGNSQNYQQQIGDEKEVPLELSVQAGAPGYQPRGEDRRAIVAH